MWIILVPTIKYAWTWANIHEFGSDQATLTDFGLLAKQFLQLNTFLNMMWFIYGDILKTTQLLRLYVSYCSFKNFMPSLPSLQICPGYEL